MQTVKYAVEAMYGNSATWGSILVADGIILTLAIAASAVIIAVGKTQKRKGKGK